MNTTKAEPRHSTSPAPQATTPIYLDCDPGIDDATALTFLLRTHRASLVGVGTVAGNVDAYTGACNAADLLQLAGRLDIPVAIGATRPLAGDFSGGFPHVHGEDGFGGVSLPPAALSEDAEDAIEQLINCARRYAGRLRVVAVGPLTNLALALEREPALAELLDEVFVMGGALDVPGNVTPFAEANFWSDPEAADQVLRSKVSVTVVPLDVTMDHALTSSQVGRMSTSADPLARSLADMLRFYGERHEALLGDAIFALHDPLTAALATHTALISNTTNLPLRVETRGQERGALTMGTDQTPNVRIVRTARETAAAEILQIILMETSAHG
ncbi:nucleoside hydrolase [Brevibacterium oceani]|uniref:nucleoside hydrolase n=1 Tax=Brevibacterium oceani TaxID=358099 RepID=UPI001B344EA9|nr:nucleoside hydrolase [Brevibacterium oceani]